MNETKWNEILLSPFKFWKFLSHNGKMMAWWKKKKKSI